MHCLEKMRKIKLVVLNLFELHALLNGIEASLYNFYELNGT